MKYFKTIRNNETTQLFKYCHQRTTRCSWFNEVRPSSKTIRIQDNHGPILGQKDDLCLSRLSNSSVRERFKHWKYVNLYHNHPTLRNRKPENLLWILGIENDSWDFCCESQESKTILEILLLISRIENDSWDFCCES